MWIKFKSIVAKGTCELKEVQDDVCLTTFKKDTYNVRVNGDTVLKDVPLDVANFVVNKIFETLEIGANTLDIEAVLAEYSEG